MSEERLEEYVFDIEREMKHLKNIIEKDDSLTISSRFVKYLIRQVEGVEGLNEKLEKEVNASYVLERRLSVEIERVQELEDVIYQDARQAVLEGLYEENKRYREALKGVIDITGNEDWSKYEATALQDSIHDFITIKNSDLLEESK